MSLEQQIALIQKELESLEEVARTDSSLKPPIIEENSAFFEEQIKSVFSDDPNYWMKKKRPGGHFDLSDPSYISDLKAIRLRQKEREETLQERIVKNRENFFSRAEEAVSLTKQGIDLVQKGNHPDAISLFRKAYKAYPLKHSTGLSAILCFNLGKAYFENGDFDLGVYYLSKYCIMQEEGDYYKSVLDQLMNLEYKHVSEKNILKGGNLFGKNFKYSSSKVIFSQTLKVEGQELKLGYKIPFKLDLEFVDKEKVTLLDYQYLIEVQGFPAENIFLEIILPLNKFPVFVEEFYGTLLEYGAKVKELNDFNTLYTESYVAEKLFGSFKNYERKELKALNSMKSIALIELPAYKVDQVIDDYKIFLSLFVLNQKTDKELDQIEIAEIRKKFEEENFNEHMQDYGYFYTTYKHHLKVAEEYARHRVTIYNLASGISNPFNTENKVEYEKARIYYWSLLNGAFSIYDHRKMEAEEKPAFASLAVQNSLLKKLIITQWEKINIMLEIDPSSALLRSRTLIEGVVSEIFKVKGYSFQGKNGETLDLKEKCDRINWALDSDTQNKLNRLRFKGNSCSHHTDIIENYYGQIELLSKEQALQYIQYLEEVITFLIKRFRL